MLLSYRDTGWHPALPVWHTLRHRGWHLGREGRKEERERARRGNRTIKAIENKAMQRERERGREGGREGGREREREQGYTSTADREPMVLPCK